MPDKSAPVGYVGKFDRQVSPRSAFHLAVLEYLELPARSGENGLRDGRRAAIVRLFDNKTSWGVIRGWIRGRRPVPKWAKDTLARKIALRRERTSRSDESLKHVA